MRKKKADERAAATPAPDPKAERASETQASVRATDDAFDPYCPQSWPDGMLLKSNVPSTAEIVEAYQAWLANERENERNALLRRIVEATSAPVVERMLIDAPEAARLMGISVPALWKRRERGQLPPGGVVETGGRVQFHREKLLAGIAKRAR